MPNKEFQSKSYWMKTREYIPGETLQGDIEVDAAIVGGGFTGLSTAYHLKKAEPTMRIAILESEVIGYGASGRNGGFNMTLFGLTLSITALRFGKAKAKQAHHYMERAVDLLQDLVHELNLDCDYEHPGFLRVATSEKYKKRILHEIEFAEKLGLEGIEWLDQDRIQEEVKSPMYLGAWWEPRCGILNPAKLSWSWAETIRPMGIEIYERTPVTEVSRGTQKITLSTPKGKVRADKLVFATNAWSHFFPKLKSKQIPVWTHIVITEPLTDEQYQSIGWQNRQGIEDARNLVHYYRLTADNRILMGGRDVSLSKGYDMDRDHNEKIFQGLRNDVIAIFPPLKNINFSDAWGIDKDIIFGMFVDKGELTKIAFLSEADAFKEAEYIIAATPQEWKKILRKQSKFITDFMLGKIKLEHGSKVGVLGVAPHANTVVDLLTQVDLQFPDEMSAEELAAFRTNFEKFRAELGV